MKKYKGIISFTDGSIEEFEIRASTYIEAMRLFHMKCNEIINLEHKEVKQTLLDSISNSVRLCES